MDKFGVIRADVTPSQDDDRRIKVAEDKTTPDKQVEFAPADLSHELAKRVQKRKTAE